MRKNQTHKRHTQRDTHLLSHTNTQTDRHIHAHARARVGTHTHTYVNIHTTWFVLQKYMEIFRNQQFLSVKCLCEVWHYLIVHLGYSPPYLEYQAVYGLCCFNSHLRSQLDCHSLTTLLMARPIEHKRSAMLLQAAKLFCFLVSHYCRYHTALNLQVKH